MSKSQVWPGTVDVHPWHRGTFRCRILNNAGDEVCHISRPLPTKEAALRDAAVWLEDRGYVPPPRQSAQ